jgi:ribosomal-protein-alanine N-acetyltransferase
VRLTDGTVTLRPWTDEVDLEELARLTRDAEVLRWTRIPDDNDAEKVREAVLGEHEDLIVGIFDAVTGEILGGAGLHRASREDARVEAGYWVAARHRARGVATRALRLLTDHALNADGWQRVELHIDPENRASRTVAERAGFELEGILRAYEQIKGRRVDVAMYARIASAP